MFQSPEYLCSHRLEDRITLNVESILSHQVFNIILKLPRYPFRDVQKGNQLLSVNLPLERSTKSQQHLSLGTNYPTLSLVYLQVCLWVCVHICAVRNYRTMPGFFLGCSGTHFFFLCFFLSFSETQ